MDFNEYQRKSRKTAFYPDMGLNFVYPALGLCGESGEVAEKVKKILRDDGGVVSDAKKQQLKKELGDVLWYLSNIAVELDLSLDDIACSNVGKLSSRKDRGTLKGDGDDR